MASSPQPRRDERVVDPTREPDLEDQERADPEETPEYVKLEDLPYRGGGIMGRRRRAR